MSVAIVGGGAWGTALAAHCARSAPDRPALLVSRNMSVVDEINHDSRNSAYLADINLPDNLRASHSMADLAGFSVILVVTPTQSLGSVLPEIDRHGDAESTLVLCSKGIDRGSGFLPHQLAANHVRRNRIAALSGPSFAHDVARGKPTAVALAAETEIHARDLANRLSSPVFRIYASTDLTGVEAGGALKNVLALAVGVARGLDLGASAEAALIARGFAEMSRIAVALGGRSDTLMGLSGLGDLVLTCSSPQSRNFAYGMAMGRGESLDNRPLAEGVHTADMALKLARDHAVDAPIVEAVAEVLQNKLTPTQAVHALLTRPLKTEKGAS